MRIDADKGDIGWLVWDVPACRELRPLKWIDDELAQFGACRVGPDGRVLIIAGDVVIDVHQRTRILIFADRKLVLVDPIDDVDEFDRIALEALPLTLVKAPEGRCA